MAALLIRIAKSVRNLIIVFDFLFFHLFGIGVDLVLVLFGFFLDDIAIQLVLEFLLRLFLDRRLDFRGASLVGRSSRSFVRGLYMAAGVLRPRSKKE